MLKKRNGIPEYWCIKHKFAASDKKEYKLDRCLCKYKDLYNNILNTN